MNNPKLFVPDASCLILFYQFNQMGLLEDIIQSLGGKLLLLSPVIEELRLMPENALKSVKHDRKSINDYQKYQTKFHIGKGEAAIMKFGEKTKIIAIIDDFKARKIALKMGIDVKGTLGLLGAGYVQCPIKTKNDLITLFHEARTFGFRLPPVNSFVETLQKK